MWKEARGPYNTQTHRVQKSIIMVKLNDQNSICDSPKVEIFGAQCDPGKAST
jgi:hypothetical protein